MPKLAQFDSTISGQAPVLGWYDTDRYTYASLPAAQNLLTLTDAQWAARLTGSWAVQGGSALVVYTPPAPPPPTLAEQANALWAGGLAVTSTATSALDGTYAADADTIAYVNSELNAIALNGTFADGGSTVAWPDTGGALHIFTIAQFKSFAAVLGAFVAGIRKCVIAVPGATLPPATATIP
jgi:hypothetical protein